MAIITDHLQLLYNYANNPEQADTEKLIEAIAQLLVCLDKEKSPFFATYIDYAVPQGNNQRGPIVRQAALFSALLQKFQLGAFIRRLYTKDGEPVQLKDIKLSGLSLGNTHARIIARILDLGAPVETLDLSNNQLERSEFNLLCNPMYRCSTLKNYNLNGNPIELSMHEGSIHNAMRLLHLVHRNSDDLRGLSSLLKIKTLNEAKIQQFNQLVVKLSAAAFKNGCSLLKLYDSFLLFDTESPSTKALKTRLTNYRLKNILIPLSLGNIETLNLSEKRFSYMEFWFLKEMIKNNISIKYLDLSGTSLEPRLLKKFAAALRSNNQITRLDLSDTKLSLDNIAEVLAIMHAPGSKCAITQLRLAGLRLGGFSTIRTPLISLLQKNKITVLDLEDTDLKNEEIKQIAEYLKQKDCTLTALDLTGNNLTNEHAEILEKALECNTSLTDLALDDNQISDVNLQRLQKILENNATCKSNANYSISSMISYCYDYLKGPSPKEEDDHSVPKMEHDLVPTGESSALGNSP